MTSGLIHPSGDTPYRVSATATDIHIISYRSSSRGLTLKTTTLDSITGSKTDQHTLSSESDVYSERDIIYVASNSAAHILAWSDSSRQTLKVNVLGSSHVETFKTKHTGSPIESITIHASGRLDASPHFLAHYASADAHWAEVYHIDLKTSSVSKAYDLPKLQGKGAFTETTVDANVYFIRIMDDNMILLSSVSHGVLEKWPVTGSPTVSSGRPYPVHAASELVARGGTSFAVRSAVLLSNGDWVLIRNGEIAWGRVEALASAVKAVFVPPRIEPALLESLEAEAVQDPVSAYIHRVSRHLQDAQYLPAFFQRLLSPLSAAASAQAGLSDSFGFNRLVVVATKSGRLIGIESGNQGRVAFNIEGVPVVEGEAWHASPAGKALAYFESADRPEVFGALLDLDNAALTSLEAHLKTLGSSEEVIKTTEALALMTYKGESHAVKGYRGLDMTWEFNLKPGQTLLQIERPMADEPIASIGKVLGDRRVLYKYLNPNAILVLATDTSRKQLTAYLLDSVSGNVLHSTIHNNVATDGPVAAVLSENWFAYSFASDAATDATSKGYQLAFGELLESELPDVRGYLDIGKNSSTLSPQALALQPYVLMQTYHTPSAISGMAVTQTGQGITSRELLCSLADSNAIVGIPRYLLDPRRIIGKAPTAQQAEEGLSTYSPMLDFDPKWYLNHKEELVGIKEIVTSPSSLESTSLVFAYGHDVFGTRRTPSFAFDVLGNSFNKVTLILTVVGLTIGTIAIAPFIERKQTNMIWQNS